MYALIEKSQRVASMGAPPAIYIKGWPQPQRRLTAA
jgi:hypothetical protein